MPPNKGKWAPALSGCGAGSERDLRTTLSLKTSPVNPWPSVGHDILQEAARPAEAELILNFVFHDYREREDVGFGGNWRLRPASNRQIDALLRFGIDARNQRLNKGNARQLINLLIGRSRRGLCNFRIARALFWHANIRAHNLTTREAARLLEALQESSNQ